MVMPILWAGSRPGTDVFDGCEPVYVCSAAGSDAENCCRTHGSCAFMEEGQN